MGEKKPKKVFVEGPISATFIADAIAKHSGKLEIGAHQIFLGQVRKDWVENKAVEAIEYSCYESMAEEVLHEIRESCFAKFPITCMHIYHSLGNIKSGEICLFIFTSSPHRAAATEACNYLVERIKKDVPIWGKEIFSDDNHQWKVNK